MTQELIMLALILLVIYFYYQKPSEAKTYFELDSESESKITNLESQLNQAQQLERFNGQQLETYQAKISELEAKLATYGTGD